MRFITLSLAAAFAGLSLASPAQADDTQAWGTVNVNVALGGPWRVQSETVLRTSDARGFYEIEQSAMAGYRFDKKVTLWAGYVHNPTYSHGDFLVMERRFRQQLSLDNVAKVGPVSIGGRLRLEERWRDSVGGTGWRLRPQVKLSTPLVGKATVSLSHESFVNLNTTTFQRTPGYDRMRNAVAVSVPLSKKVSVDVGYLNQHAFVRRGPDNTDHVLTVGLAASF